MRASVPNESAVKGSDIQSRPADWKRQSDPVPPPNALMLFAKLASALLDASGWMLLHRPSGAWQLLAAYGIPERLRPGLLTGRADRQVAATPVSLAVGDGSADGHLLEIGIGHGDKPHYSCILLRSDAMRPFRGQEIESVVRSLPHVAILLAMEERLRKQETVTASSLIAGQLGVWLLDKFGADICLVDRDLHPVLVPQTVLGRHELRLQDNCLSAAEPEDNKRLRAAVAAVLDHGADGASVQGLSFGKDEARKPLLVAAMDVVAPDHPRQIAALLLPRESTVSCDAEVIRSMFGLSRVEATIVKLLCDGGAPNDVAERMRMSQNTLRHYMKAIFRKLNVHRQSDLIRLIATTAGLLRHARRAAAPALVTSTEMAMPATSLPSELH